MIIEKTNKHRTKCKNKVTDYVASNPFAIKYDIHFVEANSFAGKIYNAQRGQIPVCIVTSELNMSDVDMLQHYGELY